MKILNIPHGSHIGQLVFVRFDPLKLLKVNPSTTEVKRWFFLGRYTSAMDATQWSHGQVFFCEPLWRFFKTNQTTVTP